MTTPAGLITRFGQKAKIRYIDADDAKAIDDKLMGSEFGFTLPQLVELAGLSVAEAVYKVFPVGERPPNDKNGIKQPRTNERVLVCCGPGNQGADGLVAARHLFHFGYAPSIFYPKEGSNEFYQNLKKQCETLNLPLIGAPLSTSLSSFAPAPDAQTTALKRAIEHCDIVLDAVFGFSFHGEPRPPFDKVMDILKSTDKPIVSVDIPSGWDVGAAVQPLHKADRLNPQVLVSLTAPKLGATEFALEGGRHFLGGRFVPTDIDEQFKLGLPVFPGTSQVIDITVPPK